MNETSTVGNFLYDFSSTPLVTAISPSVLNVKGGVKMTINGSMLPIWPNEVKIGDQNVQIIHSDNNSIIIMAPSMAPGIYDFIIKDDLLGYAHVNMKIEYKLYVSSLSPRINSIQGGALTTIYGDGFSKKCSENLVSFGPSKCDVVNCTNSWIQCVTSSGYVTHEINNDATDPYYGKGYLWSKPEITIGVGEKVHWSWRPAPGVTDVKFQGNYIEFIQIYR